VPDGDLAAVTELIEHTVAVGLADILQVDCTEAVLDALDKVDDGVRIWLAVLATGIHAESNSIDTTEVLHEHGLTLHNTKTTGRSHITITEHTGGIGDNGDEVATVGELVRHLTVVTDVSGNLGDTRSVPGVEPVETGKSSLGDSLHLTTIETVSLLGKSLVEDGLGLGLLLLSEVLGEALVDIAQILVQVTQHCSLYLSI